tara:strand:+ start:130 stop:414 length:285 start_codon:yes stop_codon:yes gene_type:complete
MLKIALRKSLYFLLNGFYIYLVINKGGFMTKYDCKLCSEPVDKGRWALGKHTCLECGEALANEISLQRRRQIAPAYNKGAYQYITKNDLKTIGR